MEKKNNTPKNGAIFFKSALNRHPFFSFHAPHPLGGILQTCVVASQVAVSALGSSEREAPEVPPILRGDFKATENQWLRLGFDFIHFQTVVWII